MPHLQLMVTQMLCLHMAKTMCETKQNLAKKVVGFRKGCRAQRTTQQVEIKGPFRYSMEQASNDAFLLGAATTLKALEKAKEKSCSKS